LLRAHNSFADVSANIAAAAASAASAAMNTPVAPATPSKANDMGEVATGQAPTPPSTSSNAPTSTSKSKGGFFGTFEGAINRLSAFEKQAMTKERERKAAADTSNTSVAATQHAAIPIIEMDSDHSDHAGEAGSQGSRTPSAGHTDGEERFAALDVFCTQQVCVARFLDLCLLCSLTLTCLVTPHSLPSTSHSETSSAAGSGDESDSSAARTSIDNDSKRPVDSSLQVRPPSPGGSTTAAQLSGKKEGKRGSMFGSLFDKKDKDKDASGSVEKDAPAATLATPGDTAPANASATSSSLFKLTGNFFDKKDKDSKSAGEQKEKDSRGKELHGASAAPLTAEKDAAAASVGVGGKDAASDPAAASGSRFKFNLNLGFGNKTSTEPRPPSPPPVPPSAAHRANKAAAACDK
jgi:hypothetical protein